MIHRLTALAGDPAALVLYALLEETCSSETFKFKKKRESNRLSTTREPVDRLLFCVL